MRPKSKNPKDVRFNIRMTKSERKAYKELCKLKGTTISKRLRELMTLELDEKLCQKN